MNTTDAQRRIIEIARVLTRHLAGTAIDVARDHLRPLPGASPHRHGPEHVRDALAELGSTFIKLGQVLSTRPDLIAPGYEAALSSLQDAAPPVSYDEVRAAIHAELQADPSTLFSWFCEDPIAAASIGQVHAARLLDGSDVVVKVRRPGILPVVDADLNILRRLAAFVTMRFGPLRRIDLSGFVDEFATTLLAELDYVKEGHNADEMRAGLTALGVHVPKVFWEVTTPAVLTLERVHGAKISDLVALGEMRVDRGAVARDVATAYLSMVFVSGLFHADPHPGNLFVETNGRVAMVDFGMVGAVTPEIRSTLVEILLSLATRDAARCAAALRRLGVVPDGVVEARFAADLERLNAAWYEVPVGDMRLAPLITEFMSVSRRHHLRFPRELGLLVKTIVMCEGLAARLDPTFAMAPVLALFLQSGLSPPSESLPTPDESRPTPDEPRPTFTESEPTTGETSGPLAAPEI